MKHIPGMSESDATIYFLTYRNLCADIDNQNPSSASGSFGAAA